MERTKQNILLVIITFLLGISFFNNNLYAESTASTVTEQIEEGSNFNGVGDDQKELTTSMNAVEKENEDSKNEENIDTEEQGISVSEEEEVFQEKKSIVLSDEKVRRSMSYNSKIFLYSSNQCDTMLLYNNKTLQTHSYIDCYGYLMEYLGQNSRDSNYYDIRFQGGVYAIKKENVLKLLSDSQIKSFPYYINEGGYITHYIENNPEIDDSYIYISQLGKAPIWMKEGQRYYSFDGVFFTDEITKLGEYDNIPLSVNRSSPYYDYYLYLPLRSQTKYSSNELSQAFNHFYSQSSYKNRTTVLNSRGGDFISAQTKYGVNALLVLSMAIHESAYGTSNFAIDRNNLFGVGAVDSDPGQAAWFSSVGEGISEQGNFLSWTYADADYAYGSIYYGSHVGNKSSGMNVKYASDPFWGEKIGRSMALIDRYLNERDYDTYNIGLARQGSDVFWSYDGKNFAHKYKYSTSDREFMYPVILENSSELSEIVMEPPYNSEKYVGGRYPNGGAFNSQYRGYVKKSDYINIKSINSKYEIIKDGNVYFYLDNNKNIVYSERFSDNGVLLYKYLYYSSTKYGQHGKNIQYVFKLNNMGEIEYGEQRRKGTGAIFFKYLYYSGTTYENRGKNIQYVFKLNDKGEIEYGEQRRKETGSVFYKYLYYLGTSYEDRGKNIQYVFKLNSNGEIEYAEQRRKGTGRVFIKYFYYPNTKYGDNHGQKIAYSQLF